MILKFCKLNPQLGLGPGLGLGPALGLGPGLGLHSPTRCFLCFRQTHQLSTYMQSTYTVHILALRAH